MRRPRNPLSPLRGLVSFSDEVHGLSPVATVLRPSGPPGLRGAFPNLRTVALKGSRSILQAKRTLFGMRLRSEHHGRIRGYLALRLHAEYNRDRYVGVAANDSKETE